MSPHVAIGRRLELFVDDHLIQSLGGGARQVLHHPQPREIVLSHGHAWEGNVSGYHTFLQDGGQVRVYYRGAQLNERIPPKSPHPEVTCMALSEDGIHWTKPTLGRVSFQGSRANNILLDRQGTHNFAPFIDTNPDVSPQARYKALGSAKRPLHGLLPFVSPDGISWQPASSEPVISDGKFDSQNVAFWDEGRQEYRAYYRDFRDGVRGIKTATSSDFLHWTPGEWLRYTGAPEEQLYTNQVLPYFRAPHIFVGFPTRYLPDRGQITEGVFMSSRDGVEFHRWGEAYIRPGLNRDRWGNRCNYIWHGLIETPSDLPGAPNELSLYSTEHYYEGNTNYVRRFTLRMDGFVSIQAPLSGGELVTRPLTFTGEKLLLNVSTAAAGSLRVELQDPQGNPLEGYTLEACDEIWGDTIEHTVTWGGDADVSKLVGQPIRIRFALRDADLYSLRFA